MTLVLGFAAFTSSIRPVKSFVGSDEQAYTTAAPWAASSWTTARPMGWVAPVTIQTKPYCETVLARRDVERWVVVLLSARQTHQFAIGAVRREVLAFGFFLGAHVRYWSDPNGLDAFGSLCRSEDDDDASVKRRQRQDSCHADPYRKDAIQRRRRALYLTVVCGGHSLDIAIHWS
jgi:hypothetical protein